VSAVAPGGGRGLSPVVTLELDAQGLAGRRLYYAAFGESDRDVVAVGEVKSPTAGRLRLTMSSRPASVVFRVVTVQTVEYPYEFKDVPLRQRPPRQIEPVRFPGHDTPVSLEFVRLVPQRERVPSIADGPVATPAVTLKLVNHCQKRVEQLRLKVLFFDATGQLLKEAVVRKAMLNRREFKLEPFKAGEPFDVEVPELPEGAVKATATVLTVGFTDGTAWRPDK
jgi:hypothetical protein